MIQKLGVGGAILAVAGLLTMRDFYSHTGTQANAESSMPDISNNMHEPKLQSRFMVPTLKFMYCRVYQEYSNFIRERYPSIAIEGDNYPPPTFRAMLAQVLSMGKLALIVMVVSGYDPFTTLGSETPQVYTWAIQNKMYACMMVFFISNAVEGQLISTGAFEVSYNDVPVWSKLETGRVPSPQEMVQILDSQMRMSGGVDNTAGQDFNF